MLKFGVIGFGYWGPNIVRNLRALEGCQVVGICDQAPGARKRIQAAHPGIPVHSDARELTESAEVDAIAVITPVWTHYELAKAALGKRQARFRREALYQQCARKRKN